MKKFLTLLLGIALIAPLYSQEAGTGEYGDGDETAVENAGYLYEEGLEDDLAAEPEAIQKKKEFGFARQHFTIGSDIGGGFDNGIIGTTDILKKDIVIDLSKIARDVTKDGAGMNFGLYTDFFLDIKNIQIGEGLWDFGFTTNIDGNINLNISKSLFTLIAEGNANKHNNSGKISASGGIFTEIGLTGSAKYKVSERTLNVGIKPAIYTPAVYIPSSTGISYKIYTEKNGNDGLFLDTKGEISVYTPTSFDNIEPGRFIVGPSGFDMSVEGEYALFPFLDVGGSFTHIPFAPAILENEMKMGLKEFSIELEGEKLMNGEEPKIPEFDFEDPVYVNNVKKEVRRPFRFDVYACYKPLKTGLLVLRPNIGFSVNATKGDEKGYFNAGFEAKLNLRDIFTFYLGSGYQEEIWKQKMGLALNFRAFELDLETALRNQTFAGCFMGRGFAITLGTRVGW
jgi:hypothetical protein